MTDPLISKAWYWIRRADGSLAPYRFHQLCEDEVSGRRQAEFFVGSFIQVFELSQVVGKAEMPAETLAANTRGEASPSAAAKSRGEA